MRTARSSRRLGRGGLHHAPPPRDQASPPGPDHPPRKAGTPPRPDPTPQEQAPPPCEQND